MRKVLIALAAAAAPLAFVPAAHATQTISISGASGTFGNDAVTCAMTAPCSFTNTFTFMTPAGYNLSSATISSVQTGGATTNIDFSSVTLNGVSFNSVMAGTVEFQSLLNQALISGATNTISVNGTSGGNASYSGTLSFAAVPEPATWALMLVGFGVLGYSMRRRPSARFAQAI